MYKGMPFRLTQLHNPIKDKTILITSFEVSWLILYFDKSCSRNILSTLVSTYYTVYLIHLIRVKISQWFFYSSNFINIWPDLLGVI